MKITWAVIVHGILVACMIRGGGIANVALAINVVLMMVGAIMLTTAVGSNDKKTDQLVLTQSGDSSRIPIRMLIAAFIVATAYQGFIAAAVFLAVVWLYIFIAFETIRKRASKRPTITDDQFNAMKSQSDKRKSGNDSMH